MIRTKESLRKLIDSKEVHRYVEAEDPRHRHARWHIYGDHRHNFLWFVFTNVHTGEQAIECIQSRVHAPPMKERRAGIADDDAILVQRHTEYMWDKYNEKLVP